MILALQSAITTLLETRLPNIFAGATPASLSFPEDSWIFDPMSADPVAGEPGPQDARDLLPFDPAAPSGPHTLTRSPYPGPKRIYLRATGGGRIALSQAEISWDENDARIFTLTPRAVHVLDDFDQLEVLYGIISASTQLKTLHKFVVEVGATDGATTENAFTLALAVLTLHRATLIEQGSDNWTASGYQAQSTVKELKLVSGQTPSANTRQLEMSVQVEMRLQRLLGEDEGTPISHILSPGQTADERGIIIEPEVEA